MTSQPPDPSLALGEEEWQVFVLSGLPTQVDNRIKLKHMSMVLYH